MMGADRRESVSGEECEDERGGMGSACCSQSITSVRVIVRWGEPDENDCDVCLCSQGNSGSNASRVVSFQRAALFVTNESRTEMVLCLGRRAGVSE